MFCGHLWSLFPKFKSCARSMACEHPKSFISKTLSPKSEQVQTLTEKSHMKVKNISILRTKSPVKEIPSSVLFLGISKFHLQATRNWLFSSAFFQLLSFEAPKGRSLGLLNLETNVGTKSKEFLLKLYGIFVHGKWQLRVR